MKMQDVPKTERPTLPSRSSQAKEEIIAVCGDVFWKENYPEDDSYASDPKQLKASRQKVLQSADFIIPGHAGMYKVK